MKRKNVLRKDFYMEIAKTFNRFISIFLIVAMGVAFFSGYGPQSRICVIRQTTILMSGS